MFEYTISIHKVKYFHFLYLSTLVDIVDGSFEEFNHMEDSTLLFFRVVTNPVEEVELGVDFEGYRPPLGDLGGQEVVDIDGLVGGGVVQDLLSR